MEFQISIGKAVLCTGVYFLIMLLYTFLNVTFWRKAFPQQASFLNLCVIALLSFIFILSLRKTGFEVSVFDNLDVTGIVFSLICAVALFLLLDLWLDPFFAKLFPQSDVAFQESVHSLLDSPVAGFIRTCLIAPFVEEILMRGFVLGGLTPGYGVAVALLVSSMLFALLHFNMVQTLSAFLCGVVLGLLYLQTGSIFCCILAHFSYNVISYLRMLSNIK